MATFDRGNKGIHNWLKVTELLVYVSLCYVLISSKTSHFVLENLLSLDAGGWLALRTGSFHDLHSESPKLISFRGLVQRFGLQLGVQTLRTLH